MKALSNILNKTPWWALLAGGLALFIGLAVFVTPFHLMRLEKSGATLEENRAIKREIDSAFSEGAINVASGIVRELLDHTKDPARRAELERALIEIDQAREELRSAGEGVIRAKREAAEAVTGAVQDATEAIGQAQKQAAQALKDAGLEDDKVQKSLAESMQAAKTAREQARKAARDARDAAREGKRAKHPEGEPPGFAFDVGPGIHVGPVIPLPRAMRSSTVSAWSSSVWAVRICAAPAARGTIFSIATSTPRSNAHARVRFPRDKYRSPPHSRFSQRFR